MEIIRKIFIKDVNDLPKEDGYYIIHYKVDDQGQIQFSYYSESEINYWIRLVDWYLQPYEIDDADIEAWAERNVNFATDKESLVRGAKAVLNGEIKHIDNGRKT